MTGSASVHTRWDEGRRSEVARRIAAMHDTPAERRFIMGRNVYAEAVAQAVPVAGFIDDFTSDASYRGKPVVRLSDVPPDAFVIAVSGGRPLTVAALLDARGLQHLDYFSLREWSGLDLPEAVFNEGFRETFAANRDRIDWLFDRLADDRSREVLAKLASFRHTYDVAHLADFTERQHEQYFEDFFDPARGAPVFVDVGGFDGFTSSEFIKRAPDYRAVYIFEPDPGNQATCRERFAGVDNIHVLPFGAGAQDATLRFTSAGSASTISDAGDLEIGIRRIDDLVADRPTFIKMDIEGAEAQAIEGAQMVIARDRPVLAIAVYHRPSDLWSIPAQIDAIAPGYRVYLRHYTESIYETVMYFVPEEG